MRNEYGAEYCEELDRVWTNKFIRKRGWRDYHLVDPVAHIEQFADALPGTEILDAGCGWARYVSRFIDRGLRYHGLDLSDEAIAYAREAHPALSFEVGNFRLMPYRDRSFDGIWSCCTLGTIPKRYTTEVLSQRLRVLRPGGILMEITPLPPYYVSEEYMDFEEGTPRIYRAYFNLDELRDYLIAAGFKILNSGIDLESGSQHILAQA